MRPITQFLNIIAESIPTQILQSHCSQSTRNIPFTVNKTSILLNFISQTEATKTFTCHSDWLQHQNKTSVPKTESTRPGDPRFSRTIRCAPIRPNLASQCKGSAPDLDLSAWSFHRHMTRGKTLARAVNWCATLQSQEHDDLGESGEFLRG